MVVSIKGSQYEMTKQQFKKTCRDIIKCLKKGTIMIVAIEKDGFAVMKNDRYNTQKELNEAIEKWKSKGYKVQFTRG